MIQVTDSEPKGCLVSENSAAQFQSYEDYRLYSSYIENKDQNPEQAQFFIADLFKRNFGLVVRTVDRFSVLTDTKLEWEHLISIASEAFCKAIERYDLSAHCRLSTYACRLMFTAMRNENRTTQRIKRSGDEVPLLEDEDEFSLNMAIRDLYHDDDPLNIEIPYSKVCEAIDYGLSALVSSKHLKFDHILVFALTFDHRIETILNFGETNGFIDESKAQFIRSELAKEKQGDFNAGVQSTQYARTLARVGQMMQFKAERARAKQKLKYAINWLRKTLEIEA